MDGTAEVAERVRAGERVVVEAVPGAGKTTLLARVATPGTLVVAYNRQLAAEVRAVVEQRGAQCLTFHALCCRCLAPAHDDDEMEKAVTRAESGVLVPTDVPSADLVVVDEAQDVRPLYVRLLHVLGLAGETFLGAMVVAGDRDQLLYDFDPAHPACLRALCDPATVFGGAWTRIVLAHTHRLTPRVSRFVNAVFGTTLHSLHAAEGAPVEVRAPAQGALYAGLRDVFEDDDDILLLVDRKQGNRPLRALLNTLSRTGRAVAVHGVHAPVRAAARNVVRCGTFWSAKGLECGTAIVLLPAAAPRAPTYVALTRARSRVIVVLDPREPHAAVCAALADGACNDVRMRNAAAQRAVCAGALRPPGGAFSRRDFTSAPRNLDRWLPPRSTGVSVEVDEDGAVAVPVPVPPADDMELTLRIGLVSAELRATGVVRAMEDVLHVTRLDAAAAHSAVGAGLASRYVPHHVSDDELLAPDLRATAAAAYARARQTPTDLEAVSIVALAVLAWDAWDHCMRASLGSVSQIACDAAPHVAYVHAICADVSSFDVRLGCAERYARVHATTSARAVHFVWIATSTDVLLAATRAALHPSRTCALVEVCHRRVRDVRVDDAAAILP